MTGNNTDDKWEWIANITDEVERISQFVISKEFERLYGIISVFKYCLDDWIGDDDRNE